MDPKYILKQILGQNQIRKLRRILFGTEHEARVQESLVSAHQPTERQLAVCFFAPEQNRFVGDGKVGAPDFWPLFCDYLRQRQIRTHFAKSHRGLKQILRQAERSVVVCIYGEDSNVPSNSHLMSILDSADIVFNHPLSGSIIRNKSLTNKALASVGCLTPRLVEELDSDAVIFSNAIEGTGSYAFTAASAGEVDNKRYNTEFVDTIRRYGEAEYFTTIRLMCINDRITHHFIRARHTSEGNPSVHAKDTPKNANLINALHREVSEAAENQLERIAEQVYRAFGPGFYAHDILVDTRTNRAIICETGYKFNDRTYQKHLHEIAHEVKGLAGYEDTANAAISSATLFAEALYRAFDLPEPKPYAVQNG